MYRNASADVPRPQPPTSPEENTNNSPAETPSTAPPSGQGGGDQATTPSYEPSYGGDSGYGNGHGGESSGGGGQGQGTSTSPPVTPLDNKQDPPPQALNPGTETEAPPELKIFSAAAGIVIALIVGIGQFFNLWFQSLFGDDGHPVPMPKLGDVDVDKLIRDLLTALMQDPAAVERAIRQAIADATPEQREQLRQLWSQITNNLDRIDDPDIREQLRQAIDRYGPVLEDALRDPQQPPRPTTPSDSPDTESPGEPRQPGDTPDSPDSPRQPGDLPEPPPTEAPDQPTPPGELPDPDTSPDSHPDEPTPPGDTPNPDKGPTAPGDTPPSPPEPDTTPETPDTPDTPDTQAPGEPSTPGEVPDHTPPDWWQPTTPPNPNTPDFRNPPEPDYAPPPGSSQKEGEGAGQASPDGDWFGRIIDQLTPPEQDPETPDVQPTPPDERTLREQLRDTYGVDQADPPSKGDPLYAFYMQLTAYQRSFWEATGWTPLGKQIHHAIEQIIWRDYPGVFSPETKHSGENTRGIWGTDAPKLHQSAIRRAWDAIYDALEGWGGSACSADHGRFRSPARTRRAPVRSVLDRRSVWGQNGSQPRHRDLRRSRDNPPRPRTKRRSGFTLQ
nr:hypothetical protein [Gordonia sp. LAM0048]